MKLASYKDGSRDGQLVVVSRDLRYAHFADHIAPTLQAVLDDWEFLAPQLETLFDALNQEDSPQNLARHRFAFDPHQCMAPLPRAYQWADGSAYVNHVELVRKARGAELPPEFWTVPIMYQGGSDDFLGPTMEWILRAKWPSLPEMLPWALRHNKRRKIYAFCYLSTMFRYAILFPKN